MCALYFSLGTRGRHALVFSAKQVRGYCWQCTCKLLCDAQIRNHIIWVAGMILQGFCNPARKLAVSPTPILLIGVRLMVRLCKMYHPTCVQYSCHVSHTQTSNFPSHWLSCPGIDHKTWKVHLLLIFWFSRHSQNSRVLHLNPLTRQRLTDSTYMYSGGGGWWHFQVYLFYHLQVMRPCPLYAMNHGTCVAAQASVCWCSPCIEMKYIQWFLPVCHDITEKSVSCSELILN